jgi:hypothetical protein
MQTDDLTLQELIVRALTSRDSNARRSLERAAAHDPELQKFCAELDDLVQTLSGAKDWRNEQPSEELRQKIRDAVVSKLPAAPPHFRTVLLEEDLGPQRAHASTFIFLGIVAAAIVLLVYMSLNLRNGTGSERLSLKGEAVYASPWNAATPGALDKWDAQRGPAWVAGAEGVSASAGEDTGVLLFHDGLNAAGAVAFSIDVKIPELDAKSSASIFLAAAGPDGKPEIDAAGSPASAITLDILPDGIQLMGPGRALLAARAVSNARGGFYRVRIEHLGGYARVTVNGDVYAERALSHPLDGTLIPGLRVSGPRRDGMLFNNVRIER